MMKCKTSTSLSRHVSETLRIFLTLGFCAAPLAGVAQPVPDPEARAAQRLPFVTVDQDTLFVQSKYGQRVQRELDAARTELASENRQIEADLIAEELDLTERREKLSSSDFSALARAFDTRVKRIRAEQDSKSTALQRKLDQERKTFLAKLGPVLADIMSRLGAVALVDRNAILLAVDEIDITDEAIAAMDAAIGEGEAADKPESGIEDLEQPAEQTPPPASAGSGQSPD